ncbi:MAG TPA: response regulator transcription factor [Bacteroidia bacterium]|nr:response regulator transcription factor [Bacteroidia bacterium]
MHSAIIYSVNNSNTEFYKKSLTKLNVKITSVYSYVDFERFLLNDSFDILIIDLELDNTDAITVIKEIKLLKLKHQPYLIVCSSKSDDFIQISAFNSGADDFVDLPVNPLVFESKIKSLLKRKVPDGSQNENKFIYIDHERYKIIIGEKAYSLPRLEFRMVTLLFSSPNKIFSKDEIASEIWHNKEVSSKRTIDIHIRNIRRELGDDIIKTYRGLGYCLKTPV